MSMDTSSFDKDICLIKNFFQSDPFLFRFFRLQEIYNYALENKSFCNEVFSSDLHPLIKYILIYCNAGKFYSFSNLYNKFNRFNFIKDDLEYLKLRYKIFPQPNIFCFFLEDKLSYFREAVFFYTMKNKERRRIYNFMYEIFGNVDRTLVIDLFSSFSVSFGGIKYLNSKVDLSNYFELFMRDYIDCIRNSKQRNTGKKKSYLGLIINFCNYVMYNCQNNKDFDAFLYLLVYFLENYKNDKMWVEELHRDIDNVNVISNFLDAFNENMADDDFSISDVYFVYKLCKSIDY